MLEALRGGNTGSGARVLPGSGIYGRHRQGYLKRPTACSRTGSAEADRAKLDRKRDEWRASDPRWKQTWQVLEASDVREQRGMEIYSY